MPERIPHTMSAADYATENKNLKTSISIVKSDFCVELNLRKQLQTENEALRKGDESLAAWMDKVHELEVEYERLRALCLRESKVLKEALKRKNNKSMISVVVDSLEEQALKVGK